MSTQPHRAAPTRRSTDLPALPASGAALCGYTDVVWTGLCAEWAAADYRAGRIDAATLCAAQTAAVRALDNHLTTVLAAQGLPPTSGGRRVRAGIVADDQHLSIIAPLPGTPESSEGAL